MTDRQVRAGTRAHRRLAWTLFWVVSALALGAGVVADLVYGDGSHLVAVLVSGLCVVGVAAGFMASRSSGSEGTGHVPFASSDGFDSGGTGGL